MRIFLAGMAAVMMASGAVAQDKSENPQIHPVERALEAPPAVPAPQWFLEDVSFLTREGGRWIASNADYKSDMEPYDAYGLEWKLGFANSMTGRLYGVQNGEETGDFWQFRQYWHPGKGEAVLEQFGAGGAIGVGALKHASGVNQMVQTFYAPDGGVSETAHASHNPDADTHVTESFDIVDGERKPRRVYTWKRQKD